ncbi:hypothetical protein HPP92_005057 [Vanilla planifolia]|uniref:Pentatricopeptide repeat-containing protein n=1 Tax=Vanilla planifolia TaxID=51239 RepID=A0A835VE90_VANPL|nr:hypothetical protein HPP92_005406 [Vanilla planifolia]KAG0494063.1 hypothetical protein HPP92_005057 [Vanilla planifolia]
MEDCGFRPSVITYNTLIHGFCRANRINAAIDVLLEMVSKGCKPTDATYVRLVEGMAYYGHKAEAMEVARELVERVMLSQSALRRLRNAFPVRNLHEKVG